MNLNDIILWFEAHPVISHGLVAFLGAVISAVFNLKRRALDIKKNINQKVNIIKKWPIIAIFINSNSNSLGHIYKPATSNPIKVPKKKSPLSRKQKDICKRVCSISETHSEVFDPSSSYEKAVKEQNLNEMELAAGTYFNVFKEIARVLEGVAVRNGASNEVTNLNNVVRGLEEKITNEVALDDLKNQIHDCEQAIYLLLIKIPYDPD